MTVLESVLETIGKTPLVSLDRLGKGYNGRIFAKLEYLNPGLSVKDRVALSIIRDAEKKGLLHKGDTIVELTSGNTGIGLAITCSVRGYNLIAVMSEGNSHERIRMIEALGATVELVPQAGTKRQGQVSREDLLKVEDRTIELVEKLGAFRPDQFNNLAGVEAHEFGTGEEIWEQAGGKIDAFVSFVGTSGTFTGISKCLKKHNGKIRCYAAEPASAPILSGAKVDFTSHKIQGGGYSIVPPLWDNRLCDGFLTASDSEAITTTRMLATKEGIFTGFSSGANVACALKLARKINKGKIIITVLPDSGLKYLTTDLFQ